MKPHVASHFVIAAMAVSVACETSPPTGAPSIEGAIIAAARHQIREVAPGGVERLDPNGFPHEHAKIEWVADSLGLEIGEVTFSGRIAGRPDPSVDGYISIGAIDMQDRGVVVVQVEVYRLEPHRERYAQIDAVSMHYENGAWVVAGVRRLAET